MTDHRLSPHDRERLDAAEVALKRVHRDSETIGTSTLARQAAPPSLSPAAGDVDPIELWGKRIGRGLAAAAFLAVIGFLAIRIIFGT